MSCVICCDSLFDDLNKLTSIDLNNRPAVLHCGHVFHQTCIGTWLAVSRGSGSCPTCRKKHTGDPVTLFFEIESGDSTDATEPQVKHRNWVIRRLCKKMETAQAETTAAREELDKTNARCKELEEQLKSGTVKFSEIKAKAATYKKSASDLKAASMKLEKMVAERSRGLEEHRRRIVNLEAELTEQRRIVTNLGDVRTTNEQLARSLKKERTKVDTMTTVNAKLASRLAEVEKENRRLCLTVAATAEPKGTIRDLPRATAASSSSAAINDAQIIDLVSETSIEADMDEDIDTLDNLIVQPVGRPIGQNPRPRPGTTFGMSLKEFMPPAAPDTLGGNSQSVFQPSQNPFAIADKPFESLIPKEIVFTQGRSPSNASPQRPKRPDGTAWRSQFAGMSNVLGGSRQSSTQRRKNTSTIQARITWGPKK